MQKPVSIFTKLLLQELLLVHVVFCLLKRKTTSSILKSGKTTAGKVMEKRFFWLCFPYYIKKDIR